MSYAILLEGRQLAHELGNPLPILFGSREEAQAEVSRMEIWMQKKAIVVRTKRVGLSSEGVPTYVVESGRGDETLGRASLGVACDHHHGFLPQLPRDVARERLGAAYGVSTAAAGGLLEDLDDPAVLTASSPEPLRLVPRGVGKRSKYAFLEEPVEGRAVDGGGEASVGSSRDARSHVDPHAADGSHAMRILENRAGRREGAGEAWVSFSYRHEADELVVETSWMPHVFAGAHGLREAGFARGADGRWRLVLKGQKNRDEAGIVRSVTRVVEAILRESV